MNVVDSSAWLSYFAGDKNADEFAAAVEDIEKLLVPSITLTEVFKCIMRQRDENAALEGIAHMEQGRVVTLDSSLAIDAAVFGLKYKLPLADSIIYATSNKFGAVVWTQDADFKELPNVNYFPKTNAT
ncbi:MAG: type II toxin-antitoxin system VapC family toxin [Lysobacterales bacterium]